MDIGSHGTDPDRWSNRGICRLMAPAFGGDIVRSCFFCSKSAEYGFAGDSDQHLWLCAGHWRLIGEFFIESFEDAEIIAPVEFLEDYNG